MLQGKIQEYIFIQNMLNILNAHINIYMYINTCINTKYTKYRIHIYYANTFLTLSVNSTMLLMTRFPSSFIIKPRLLSDVAISKIFLKSCPFPMPYQHVTTILIIYFVFSLFFGLVPSNIRGLFYLYLNLLYRTKYIVFTISITFSVAPSRFSISN